MFSLWLPWHNWPKLAWSPPGPDSTNSHPLQNSRVFRMVSCTELSNACLEHKSPDSSHSYPLQNSLVLLMISFTELFKSWPTSLQVQILLQAAASAAKLPNKKTWWLDGRMCSHIIDFHGFSWIFIDDIDFYQFYWFSWIFYWLAWILSIFIDFLEFSSTFIIFNKFISMFINFNRCVSIFNDFHWFSWIFIDCH